MEKPVIIFGTGGMAKAALDILTGNGVIIYGFLDDDKDLHSKTIGDIPVLGHMMDDDYLKLIGQKCEAFVAVENSTERKNLVQMLKSRRKVMPVNAIHTHSRIPASAHIEHGLFINDTVIIGTNVRIGSFSILHSGAILDFEVQVGEYSQIGAGSVVGAGAILGKEVFVGTGVVVTPGITIGDRARIGTGSVVVDHVRENETVFGNPAKKIEI